MLDTILPGPITAAIFGSCRVVRREYLPLYFERNTIDITFDQLAQFLPMIVENGFTTFVDGECCFPNMRMKVSHGIKRAVHDVKWLIAFVKDHSEVTIHFEGQDFVPEHASRFNRLFYNANANEDTEAPAPNSDTIVVDTTTLNPTPVLRPAIKGLPRKWLAWPVWTLKIEYTLAGSETYLCQSHIDKNGHIKSIDGVSLGRAAALDCSTHVRKTHISVKLASEWTSAPIVGPGRPRKRRRAT